MKSEIDLTENRIFSGNRRTSQNDLLIDSLFSKSPWNRYMKLVELDDDLDSEYRTEPIIATGNKKERARIDSCREAIDGNHCDCCGAKLNIKPWNREFGLCRKCNEYYEKLDWNRCLWREKEVIQNAEILEF